MTLKEILNKLDEVNDSYEDIYNRELHNLSEEDSEKLTVKEFLSKLLEEEYAEFNTWTQVISSQINLIKNKD